MQITFLCYLFHEFKVLKFCSCFSIIHWIYMRVQGDRKATPNVGSSADKGQTGPAPHKFRPASWTGQCDLSTGSLTTHTHPYPYTYIHSHIFTHIQTHTLAHTHTPIPVHIHKPAHTPTRPHTDPHIFTYTYTQTHTHAYLPVLAARWRPSPSWKKLWWGHKQPWEI